MSGKCSSRLGISIDARLAVFPGGLTAGMLIFNHIGTGASSDIIQAADWSRKMVTVYGLSDKLGPRTFGQKEELIFTFYPALAFR